MKYQAKINDVVHPDGWPPAGGEKLTADDGYKDTSFPGCQFRLSGGYGIELAVNIQITGEPHLIDYNWYKSRCRVEFVGDGEPSQFSGGWIYHNLD